MFCPNCGKETSEGAAFCATCGANMSTDSAPAAAVSKAIKGTSRDALRAIGSLVSDPVGGMASSFGTLGSSRALGVGIAFGLAFSAVLAIAVERLASRFASLLPFGAVLADQFSMAIRLKLFVWGLACFAAMSAAATAARLVFRGKGSFHNDVYIAGTSLVPAGVVLLAASLLGVGNVEVVAMLSVFSLCFTVMLLHSGCTQVSGIAARPASLAVPCILLASAWIAKVIIVALL